MNVCKFCGAPSQVDPADQSPPPDYCHPEDHLSDDEEHQPRYEQHVTKGVEK